MKLCLDVKDKYESVFNKLSEKQKDQLIKGLSAHANAILATLENSDDNTLDSMLKVLTGAMFLLGQITGNETDDEDEED
jgi:hypothetical protein